MRSLLDKLRIQHKGSWLHIFNVSRPSEATAGGIHLPSGDRPVDGPSHSQAIDWALTFSRPSRDTGLPSAQQGAWVGVVGWLWAPSALSPQGRCRLRLLRRWAGRATMRVWWQGGGAMACCSGGTKFCGEHSPGFGGVRREQRGWRRKAFKGEVHGPGF